MLSDEVSAILEVTHSLVEPPSFQAVANASELFVLSFNLADDGMLIGFKLGSSLMMVVVLLNFGGGEVQHMDRHSQGEKGGSVGL